MEPAAFLGRYANGYSKVQLLKICIANIGGSYEITKMIPYKSYTVFWESNDANESRIVK